MTDSGISLVVRRTIRATPQRLFDAWTRPELLEKWWGPRDVTCTAAEFDLRPGGRYRIANLLPDGKTLWITGVIEEVRPPERLVYSWSVEPAAAHPAAQAEQSRVTVQFRARGRATEVIVVHENILNEAIRDDHEAGWIGCLEGLAVFFGERTD